MPKILKTKDIIKNFNDIHGDRYDYSKFKYKGWDKKGIIICKKHGEFEQSPNVHKRGSGCQLCFNEKNILNKRVTREYVIDKFKETHGNRYDYSKFEYSNYFSKITIICKKHGEFKQTPNSHIQGANCPRCSNMISKGENEVFEFIKNFEEDSFQSDRNFIHPQEIDIIIPNKKLAIEYNGIYHHSSKYKNKGYHLNKTKKVENKGYKLFHIFSNEWDNIIKKQIWKSIILSNLNKLENTIYAKNCYIIEVDQITHSNFMNLNNIKGDCKADIKLALINKNEIVSMMSFIKKQYDDYEMVRFSNKNFYCVFGGEELLFNYFINKYIFKKQKILSICDKRIPRDNFYELLEFKFLKLTKPNSFYIKNKDLCYGGNNIHTDEIKNLDTIHDCGNEIWMYQA